MITSSSALKIFTEEKFLELYRGDWEKSDGLEHPRRCIDCNTPLEIFIKNHSYGGIYYGDSWVAINEKISPDYNRCGKCYSLVIWEKLPPRLNTYVKNLLKSKE